jgi:phosphate:Na+ symporter
MMRLALPTVFHGDADELTALQQLDDEVDALHGTIVTYLGQLSQENILKHQAKQIYHYMAIANYIENMGDMIETNWVDVGHHRLREQMEISHVTQMVITALHEKVCWTMEQALEAVTKSDKTIAQQVLAAKDEVNHLAQAAESHLTRRLTAAEPHRLASFRIESALIEYLKRMYYFAKRIAKEVDANDTTNVEDGVATL